MIRGIAITVRYAGPTNHCGSRWIARADHPEGRAVVPYSHDLDSGIENAQTAAQALVDRWNADNAARYPTAYGTPDFPPFEISAGGHTTDGYAFVVSYARQRSVGR